MSKLSHSNPFLDDVLHEGNKDQTLGQTAPQPAQAHTPGPWTQGKKYPAIILSNNENGNRFVATTCRNSDDEYQPTEKELANARLIAAAPDLLEVLKEIVETLDDDCSEGFSKARVAIAEAEGR